MYILGITGGVDRIFDIVYAPSSGLGHDSSALLLQDVNVVFGTEEERLSRIKHSNKICSSALMRCLNLAHINFSQLDAIAIYASEKFLNRKLKESGLLFPDLYSFTDCRSFFQFILEKEFGLLIDKEKFYFIHHHLAHTVSSYYLSGFEKSLILSIDGEGDDVSSMIIDANIKEFNTLKTKSVADSLGHFYLKIIAFLGYKDFDEYKVMGLAPYGDPAVYRDKLSCFYELLADGDYCIHADRILELYEVLTPRKLGEAFSQVHMDLAAALQEALESIVFHVLRHYQALTGHTRLAISGGVGQNSSMNGKILNSGLFEEVFVPSFAGDSGCAYGAAAYVAHQLQPDLPFKKVTHAYWGTPIHDDEVADALAPWQDFVVIGKLRDRSEQVSNLIIEGAVIGWVQGRSEFGPRALGNRSIIADPRIGSHKETINAMIKMRESYRPFAPSVLVERVRDFFEVPGKQEDFPFMSFVLNVRPEWRDQLPAITHVDGSARLQTVNKEDNPRYWELIETFGRKTGIPILLNTSFNNNAEPIVDSIDDAVVCYLTSGLNYLVVGDYLVTKKDWGNEQLAKLIVTLPKAAVLNRVDRYISYTERGFSHFLTWNYDTSRCYPLSDVWYQVLQQADGLRTLQQLMIDLGFEAGQQNQVFEELPSLWSDRLIILHPENAAL
ncbi:carbamoyltransferase [Methylomonas sp. LWB]|uniref:carbamoyltransferase family protein n=1 Tax=Methylomonas sp. LWB TaxID=1905845 RepID=UPI0008D95E5A|nr:carbamoyltransferase C-terminal domain-containing protein [Methylomonas sp. LWB]OHX36806.1 carbamoyltransferase [Methylomonas sp. LWB]